MLQRCSWDHPAFEHLDRLYPFALSIFRAWTLSSHSEPFLHNLLGWSFKKMASLFHCDLHARRAHAQLRA